MNQQRLRSAVLWSEARSKGIDDEQYEMPKRIENDGSIECENPVKVRR